MRETRKRTVQKSSFLRTLNFEVCITLYYLVRLVRLVRLVYRDQRFWFIYFDLRIWTILTCRTVRLLKNTKIKKKIIILLSPQNMNSNGFIISVFISFFGLFFCSSLFCLCFLCPFHVRSVFACDLYGFTVNVALRHLLLLYRFNMSYLQTHTTINQYIMCVVLQSLFAVWSILLFLFCFVFDLPKHKNSCPSVSSHSKRKHAALMDHIRWSETHEIKDSDNLCTLFSSLKKLPHRFQEEIFKSIKPVVIKKITVKYEPNASIRRAIGITSNPFGIIPTHLITKIISYLCVEQRMRSAVTNKQFSKSLLDTLTHPIYSNENSLDIHLDIQFFNDFDTSVIFCLFAP